MKGMIDVHTQLLESTRFSITAQALARAFWIGTLITLPFRLRSVLIERPFPPIYVDYTYVLLFISDVCLIATLAFWLLGLSLDRRRPSVGPLSLTLPIAGLTGVAVLSSLFSVDAQLSIYHAIRLILLAGFYLYVINEIKSLDEVILPVSIQVFIQAVVSIGQVLKQHSLGLASVGELELDPAWQGVSIVWAAGTRSLRAYGLSDHPNILGGSFAFALILIASWYTMEQARWRTVTASVFSLGALGLLLTFSRSAWIALAGGFLFLILVFVKTGQARATYRWISLISASLILLAPFVWHNLPFLGVRLNVQGSFTQVPQERQSIGERGLLIEAANTLFIERPLTGVGLGTFPLALLQRYPDLPVNYQPVHFALLAAAAETGIFGAVLYASTLIAPWLMLWLNRNHLIFSPALAGVSALLLAVTLVGLFDYYTWLLAPGRLWQWLSWGLWAGIFNISLHEVKND